MGTVKKSVKTLQAHTHAVVVKDIWCMTNTIVEVRKFMKHR